MFELEIEKAVDTREPYQKVRLEADGGIDVNGEWQFAGSYSIRVPSNTIGNAYPYKGSIWKPHTKKRQGRWKVRLEVCGGEYGRITLQVLSKSASSLKQARKMIAESILQFEKTDRYKEELWPRIIHPDHRVPILKEVNGELLWIATTWIGAWSAIQGKSSWDYFEKPFGHGQFYYREPKWEYEYPRLEDGSIDWDNGKKVYEDPIYGSIEVSYWSISGGGSKADEIKEKIDKAIWDVNDEETIQHMQKKALSLNRI